MSQDPIRDVLAYMETAQPYEQWAQARRECPVAHAQGITPSFQVTRYADAERVLRDWETFSSVVNMAMMGPYMGELILGMDGQEHRRYRNLVAPAFRASVLERWDAELVQPVLGRLLDRIAPLGRADLVRDVTSQYPVQVICGILGVPVEDHRQFTQWAEEINLGPLSPERGLRASQAMRDYLSVVVEARRRDPTGDFISELVAIEVDGERLSDEKIYGFLRLLLPAGAETTYRALGNALAALLTRPEALARVVADRTLIPAVIEETLRWETSVTMVTRVATRDVEVGGCPIPAGAMVSVLTGSADRDEARFEEADSFRFDRPPQGHLAFGTGPHQCLGLHLARLEMRAGLNAIFDRLHHLRLDPEAPPPTIAGLAFRGPDALPVLFD